MTKEFVNLDGIAKKLRGGTGLNFPKLRDVLMFVNDEIARGLKETSKARIHDFGLFYVLMKKSRQIVSIRTKTKRLLLEKPVIKFKSSPQLKHIINNTIVVRKKYLKQPAGPKSQKVEAIRIEKEPIKITPPAKRISFAPAKMMEKVEPEKFRARLKERRKDLYKKRIIGPKTKTSQLFDLSSSASGKLFASLFKQIRANGQDNIHFSLGEKTRTDIYFGRPRKKLSHIPTEVIKDFLERHLELVDFHLPQERFVKIYFSSKMGDNIARWLEVYSMPTVEGASIYLKIRGE